MLETDHDCSASDGRAVINVRYQLRASGLPEPEGTMRVSQLRKALGALATTARRATSLVATGSGSSKGRAAEWLAKATDFTVTGLKPGSTVVEVAALPLGTAAPEQFAQRDLWDTDSHADFTALDIAARAIEEAKDPNSDGNWFDSAVLGSILDFPTSTREPAVKYVLNPVGAHSRHRSFVLEGHAKQGIRKRLQAIPASRAFVVSGRLDEIKYPSKGFRLTLPDKSHLLGRLVSAEAAESLRSLWGSSATVEGTVHFKASGLPRLIEARKVMVADASADAVFRQLPVADALIAGNQDRIRLRASDSINLDRITGRWPGDESIEELMAMLD